MDGPLDLMVESFVSGDFYHVDGLVHEGKLRLVWPSKYVNTVASFKDNPFIGRLLSSPACFSLFIVALSQLDTVCTPTIRSASASSCLSKVPSSACGRWMSTCSLAWCWLVAEALEAIENAPPFYTFHAELWHTADGKFVFCEVGGRCVA